MTFWRREIHGGVDDENGTFLLGPGFVVRVGTA
jgi:hypothetical protein